MGYLWQTVTYVLSSDWANINTFNWTSESPDEGLVASRLVVLSVGFRGPRELGKF